VQIIRFNSQARKDENGVSMLLGQSKSSKCRQLHTSSCFRGGLMVWSVLAGMAMTVVNLVAQEVGNPSQGLRLAHTLCAECHLVDKLPGQSPNLIAPSFEHIANTPGMNSAALTAALRTSHESMPNIIIKGSNLSDVIAYILSLNERR
jgi:mono/diheme cytochrome c family protein